MRNIVNAYFTIALAMVINVGWSSLDIDLLPKMKMPLRDLTTELEYRLNMEPSDNLG